MAAQWFRALFIVVFGCVTLWHCVGCELLEQQVCDELHLEDAGTSELIEELGARGLDLLFDDEDD